MNATTPDLTGEARIWRPSSETPGAPAYPERTGWPVTILRLLTPAEAETDETGPMYRVRFADGTETDAFADELTREDG